jgi:hypothetical protein
VAVSLTVIVKGEDGKLLSNAEVSISPGDFTATTNSDGEATLNIDGSDRYQVHVKSDNSEQTVPFYVVNNQASAKLDINLQYFKELREVQGQSTEPNATPWYQADFAYAGYAVSTSDSDFDINPEPEEVLEVISTRRTKAKPANKAKKTAKKKK